MNKKVLILLIIFSFILSLSCLFGFKKVKSAFAEQLNIESKSCYLLDYNSKTVMYSKNENERLPIASMCKIMTLNLIFDAIDNGILDINGKITISENASKMGGSQVFLDANEEYQVRELIKGIVVASANDACVALAETIYGSEDEFVAKMNEKAKELNMNDTLFSNCTGLPKINQYSTAKDVAIMFYELLTHKEYFEFSKIWMDEIHHKNNRITEISNTNKLIRFFDGCDGGKTGYTNEAGHCLASTATKNNMRIVSVIICAKDSKSRFAESKCLFNFAFNNYENKQILNKNESLEDFMPIENGKKEECKVSPKEDYYILCKKGEKQPLQIEIKFYDIDAPISINQEVGEIEIYKDSIKISTIKLVANENIEKTTFIDNMQKITKNWCILA